MFIVGGGGGVVGVTVAVDGAVVLHSEMGNDPGSNFESNGISGTELIACIFFYKIK